MTTERVSAGLLDRNVRRLGCTWTNFSAEAGIDASVTSRYRTGEMVPSYRAAEQLARALGDVSPGEIVVDCLRLRWERDRPPSQEDLFPRHGRTPVADALDALRRTASTMQVSERFREEIEEVAERLLAAVGMEVRLLDDRQT